MVLKGTVLTGRAEAPGRYLVLTATIETARVICPGVILIAAVARLPDHMVQTGARTAGAPHPAVQDIRVLQLRAGVPETVDIQGVLRITGVPDREIRLQEVQVTEALVGVPEVLAQSEVLLPHQDLPERVHREEVEGRNNSL